jgi:hypothetical protein
MQNLERIVEKLLFYYNKDIKDIKIKNYISFIWVLLSLAGLLTINRELKKIVYTSLVIVELIFIISYSRGYKAF